MLYGLLLTLFIILCFLMILIILLQKGKSSTGMAGGLGSGAQVLFGGSGGQDIFQKITWIMGALFMGGSLVLALIKSSQAYKTRYLEQVHVPVQTTPEIPVTPPLSTQQPMPSPQDVQETLPASVETPAS